MMMSDENPIETVAIVERKSGIPRSTLYRLARAGLIPVYRVGPKLSGVRFITSEVLAALRRPVNKEAK